MTLHVDRAGRRLEDLAISQQPHIELEHRRTLVVPLVAPRLRHTTMLQELTALASGLTDQPGPAEPDLLAEDLAALALDLAQEHTATDVLGAAADGVVGLVSGASQAVVSVLRRGDVELSSATGAGAGSCEAWQLALGSGPAVTASEDLGAAVVVDDLATDPRWAHLQATEAQDGLPSILSVAAALPFATRTLVLSWYSQARGAFAAPDCARVALLAAAHTSVALDRALHADHLQAGLARRQEIGEAVGIIAARGSLTREAAFVLLRDRSQRTNQRLADIARQIVDEQG